MDNLKLDTTSLLPLRDVVYKTLRDAILKGELPPGTRLMEIHLANSLGVSRTPIREAIRMLEQEGLAVNYPRKGAQVARMTVKDMEDVLQVRKALDLLAVMEATKNADDAVIKALEDGMKAFEDAVARGDVKEIVSTDEKFHAVIYDAAGNPKLTEILKSLREQMYRYRFEYVKDKNVLDNLIEEHQQIITGIKNKDLDYVKGIMTGHIDNQYESVKKLIGEKENH